MLMMVFDFVGGGFLQGSGFFWGTQHTPGFGLIPRIFTVLYTIITLPWVWFLIGGGDNTPGWMDGWLAWLVGRGAVGLSFDTRKWGWMDGRGNHVRVWIVNVDFTSLHSS
jgi:hypothetical protein